MQLFQHEASGGPSPRTRLLSPPRLPCIVLLHTTSFLQECTQDQCVQAGACQCQAQPGFLEAFMGHVHSEV